MAKRPFMYASVRRETNSEGQVIKTLALTTRNKLVLRSWDVDSQIHNVKLDGKHSDRKSIIESLLTNEKFKGAQYQAFLKSELEKTAEKPKAERKPKAAKKAAAKKSPAKKAAGNGGSEQTSSAVEKLREVALAAKKS